MFKYIALLLGFVISVEAAPTNGLNGGTVSPFFPSGILTNVNIVTTNGAGNTNVGVVNGTISTVTLNLNGIVNTNYLTNSSISIKNVSTNATPVADTTTQGVYVDLSYNTTGLLNTVNCLFSNKLMSIQYFGDSTGEDTLLGYYNWLMNNSSNGVQPGSPFLGNSISTIQWTPTPTGNNDRSYYWVPNGGYTLSAGSVGITSNNLNFNFFFPNVTRFQVWWYGAATNTGTMTISNSVGPIGTNAEVWTNIGSIVGTQGVGLQCTNYDLGGLQAPTKVKMTILGGQFCMPGSGWGLYNQTGGQGVGAVMADMHASGLTLLDWLNMGSNNIACLLTNIKATQIIYQQTKPIADFAVGYPGYISYVNSTNFTHADNILMGAQTSSAPGDPPRSAAQVLAIRGYAVSNNLIFLDNYTPFSVWTNLMNAGLTNADTSGVHLNGGGQQSDWNIFATKLDVQGVWEHCGQYQPKASKNIAIPGGQFAVWGQPYPVSSPSQVGMAYGSSIAQAYINLTNGLCSVISDTAGGRATFIKGVGGIYFTTTGTQFGGNVSGNFFPSGGLYIGDGVFGTHKNTDPGLNNVVVEGNQTNWGGLTVAGVIAGNGSGVTNVTALHFSPTIVSTNFTANVTNTNTSSFPQYVWCNETITTVASVGATGFNLITTGTGAVTNYGTEGTTALSIAMPSTNVTISAWISPSGTYEFSNFTTVGTATLKQGQIIQY